MGMDCLSYLLYVLRVLYASCGEGMGWVWWIGGMGDRWVGG
jgi:hypothetical protein